MVGIGFDLGALLDSYRSLCKSSGGFDVVSAHELRKAPTAKFALGAWLARMKTLPTRSGLAATSILVTLQARIYVPFMGDPDQIDTEAARRVDLIWSAFHRTLELDGNEIDILGAYGDGITAEMGWLPMSDNAIVRTNDLFLPIVIDNAYPQGS